MRRAFFLALSLTGSASAITTTFGPERWPDLERVAKQVPEFAGFTFATQKTGKQVTFLALTDKTQEKKLRQVLNADPYWRGKMNLLQPGSLKLKSSVTELLSVAKAVRNANPKLSVHIDTALNRVTVNADLNVVTPLQKQLGVGDVLQKESFFSLLPVKHDVQPRTVRKSELTSEARWGRVPNLRVLVTNPNDRPVAFGYGCSGAMPVHVLTADGKLTNTIDNLGCTGEARQTIIQPHETRMFRSFSWSDLSQLAPGRYFWQQFRNGERYPFDLTP